MRALRRFLNRLATFATRRRADQRLREELEDHLALQTAENIRAGFSPVEARRRAVLKFGSIEAVKEAYRDEQGLPVLENLLQDVRYAFRQLQRAPLFTLTATLSLAMGIGANTAVFTVIERVLLRPLPVSNPEELVFVTDQRILQEPSPRFSYPFYVDLKANTVLKGTAARYSMGVSIATNGPATNVSGELVSGNYFDVVGATTALGRTLTSGDDAAPGAGAVAVISDRYWRRSFASDPSVLGRVVRINNHPFTIVGVAAEGFSGTDIGSATDIWIPMAMQKPLGRDLLNDARTNWLEIVARRKPESSLERAAAELAAFWQQRAHDAPANAPSRQLMLMPGDKGNSPVRKDLGAALRMLLALTSLALLLAGINVASLLATRSAAREKEVAVRLALGAGRSRLVRQFLTETLVLAAVGGALGLLVAPWTARLLIAAQPHSLGIDSSIDMPMFIFALAATVLTGVLVGQAPILAFRNVALTHASGRPGSAAAFRRFGVHDVIVTAQIAVSLTMLVSAALLTQSVRSLSSVDPGFRADNLLLMTIDAKAGGYDGNRIEGFWRETLDRVTRVPSVQTVTLARTVPLAPGRQRQPWFNEVSGELVEIDTNFVAPQYFRTLDIPVLRGREFDATDGKASRPVVIVNERLAQMFWPGQDPVGKGMRMARREEFGPRAPIGKPVAPLPEIVGVVKDVKYRDVRGDFGPVVYRPLFQTGSSDAMTLHVRTDGDLSLLAGRIRGELQTLDAKVPVFAVTTLEEQLDGSFAQTRQAAVLTAVFGVLALLLSGIGVYSVTALTVSRRTRDIGIRMALGADRRHILDVVGRRALLLVIAGVSLGLLGSLGFTRVAEALLYGVTAADRPTFAGMSAVVLVVSLIGFYFPVRAATRLDAVAAIRYE